ncbi:hypothetical protein F511_28506 [Dorcoceras hygrometricum]|uniref:Uncharacterized protein n=1 Tax=Dorcoceras hygrometricum TaxID=472368 RepID=A0A2Z7D9Y8_9LAMI|nr:hypothetical protein F511_28506 [Dorcoceras hygrometricum]
MSRLYRVARTLALLGEASLEDKIAASIGLEIVDESTVDFWNVNAIGDKCSGGACQVRAESGLAAGASMKSSSSAAAEPLFVCSECGRKACSICSAGKGALLLALYNSKETSNCNGVTNQGGSVYGYSVDASSRLTMLDGIVCKLCCNEIVLDALLLDYIRFLITLRRRTRAGDAARKALNHVIGLSSRSYIHERGRFPNSQGNSELLKKFTNGEESLAEFPFASFLQQVETAVDSAPFLSLLTHSNSGLHESYWKAPSSVSSVEFVIVLSSHSDVSGVVLLVSPCGYSMNDAPTVQIWAGNKVDLGERTCTGKWDLRSLLTSSSELCGPEKSTKDDKPRHIKFSFKNPVRCRIIWITLCLHGLGSNSVNLDRDFNLLSFDENPFSQLGRRASFGGQAENDPCIHAKRFLIVGRTVRQENGASPLESGQVNVRNWLERVPQLNRFKVPIEVERCIDNDLVLEQFLSPASPMLAGFRLDGFGAIKHRIFHSPSTDMNARDSTICLLDERLISPAVLYIQVFALQEHHNMVSIAEYRLPEVKAGTPMYFDFPRQISTRRIKFRLLGDIAGFSDDPSEQDDTEFGAHPWPTGDDPADEFTLTGGEEF